MPKRNLAFLALIILGGALFSTGWRNLKLPLPPAIQATLTATPVPTFHYKMEWGGLPPNPPMSTMAGLALDSTGDVYVGNGNTVLKYDGNGNYINVFG